MRKLRILLADDHETVREGLKVILNAQPDMEVVAEASDGNAAISQATAFSPDIVVMDVTMPRLNGLQATAALRECCPGVRVLTLTRHADDGYLQQLLRAGASGYVLKQSRASELLHAIRAVASGGKYLDPAVADRVIGDLGRRAHKVDSPVDGGAGTQSEGRRDSAARRLGLQQQGSRRGVGAQRQDRGVAQNQRDAQARPAQSH